MFEKAWMGPKMQNLAAHNKKTFDIWHQFQNSTACWNDMMHEFIKKYYYFIWILYSKSLDFINILLLPEPDLAMMDQFLAQPCFM